MAIEVYWGSGSPYSWRVLLALEYKRLAYIGHQLQFSRQEHKSPQILALNFRGRVPILKDGDYVVFESLAVLYYLDLKYPDPPIFGRSPEEAGVIMRVICEYQSYVEEHLMKIVRAVFEGPRPGAYRCAGGLDARGSRTRRARSRRGCRVLNGWWGENFSAADIVIFPALQLLLRALDKPAARALSSRFLPLAANYPALERWISRVAALPGYERTFPPHWR